MTDVTVTVLDPSTKRRLRHLTGAFLAGYRNANTCALLVWFSADGAVPFVLEPGCGVGLWFRRSDIRWDAGAVVVTVAVDHPGLNHA